VSREIQIAAPPHVVRRILGQGSIHEENIGAGHFQLLDRKPAFMASWFPPYTRDRDIRSTERDGMLSSEIS